VSRAGAWRVLRRGVLAPCLAWAIASVAPAWSAELVEVRVGNHPTFTRVVFEFDAPTGYRVERRAEGEPENVILVTLDATSRTRHIASHSPGVESVSVEEGFDHAIARITTREPGLPIKEMILRNPPRVVLDLMLGPSAPAEPALAKAVAEAKPAPEPEAPAAKPEPKPAPKPEAPAAKPAPKPEVLAAKPAPKPEVLAAKPEPKPAPKPSLPAVPPAPKPEAPAAKPAPKPEALAAKPEPRPAPKPVVAPVEPEPTVLKPVPAPKPGPERGDAETEFEPEVIAKPAIPPEPAVDETGKEVAAVEKAPRAPEEKRAPEAAPARPRSPDRGAARRAAEARPAAETKPWAMPFDVPTTGMIAGGALVLILVVFLMIRRRRALPNDLDVTALAAEGESADEASDDGRIPKGGFSMDHPIGGASHPAEDFEFGIAGEPRDEDKPVDSIASESGVGAGLFDEAPQEEEAMTMENQDLPITRMSSEAATQVGARAAYGGASEDSDIARIVHELERRVAHLETRLDESIDARERLERQVAAQSEELRVQRAAIARTQRALRSLNRAEEDQATEPALREPPKPAGPQ